MYEKISDKICDFAAQAVLRAPYADTRMQKEGHGTSTACPHAMQITTRL
jgi:hypothetical protein